MKQRFTFSNELQRICIKLSKIINFQFIKSIRYFNNSSEDFNFRLMSLVLIARYNDNKLHLSFPSLNNKLAFNKK